MSGRGLGCLVCIWSARQHETGRFAARQCKVETVGVYGLSTEPPSMPEAPYRTEKPGVGGSIPPLTTTTSESRPLISPQVRSRRAIALDFTLEEGIALVAVQPVELVEYLEGDETMEVSPGAKHHRDERRRQLRVDLGGEVPLAPGRRPTQ